MLEWLISEGLGQQSPVAVNMPIIKAKFLNYFPEIYDKLPSFTHA